MVLAGIFDGNHIAKIFYNTYQGFVAPRRVAYLTNRMIADVVADAAVNNILTELINGLGKMTYLIGLLPQ